MLAAETMDKLEVDLQGAAITLLIPLLGRAEETKKKCGLLRDDKAVEIVNKLAFDFSLWHNAPSLIGASIRTLMFDQMVAKFIHQHPSATVIELGCGLNTRFERLDNGLIHWFDLDLPEVIKLRREFFQDCTRRKMIAASVLDTDWFEQIKQCQGPFMFISEAAIIYLDNGQAKQAISQISTAFPKSYLAFDTCDKAMVKGQDKHDAMRYLPKTSWFNWVCDKPKEIETWGCHLKLQQSLTLVDADKSILANVSGVMGFVLRNFPFLLRRKVQGYRLNLFTNSH